MVLVMLALLRGCPGGSRGQGGLTFCPSGLPSLRERNPEERREVSPVGPQMLKQAPITGEPWCFIEQVQNQEGEVGWGHSYVPGKSFKPGFADGVTSVVAASHKAVRQQSLPKWRP